jgi:pyridoxal phosphate enzyme (YggS family)
VSIHESVIKVQEIIYQTCNRVGRNPDEIKLMGVSKFHSDKEVEEAWNAGIRLFGENRVQEAGGKFPAFVEAHPETELHLIGNLQRNKVKSAVSLFDCIESVDRESLIIELGKLCAEREEPLRLLLELHTGEESKSGFQNIEELFRGIDLIHQFPQLKIEGLMTMAPYTDDKTLIRKSFRMLTDAQKKARQHFPDCDFFCLSMGMTNDFEIAIEEGSTLLRIGTAIFGERR